MTRNEFRFVSTRELKKLSSPLVIILLLSMIFFLFFTIISGVFYLCRLPEYSNTEKIKSSFLASMVNLGGSGAVGILEINGVILDSKKLLKKLESFEEDQDIKAIVVRLNSPGGAVAPSQEIYEAIKKSKKPVISSMASVAASGAYYVACGTQKIFANAGTMTGSIGVIMSFANLERLYEWAKVKRFVIKTGKFKDVGSEFREMKAEERELLQSMIDDVLLQFKTAVSTGRNIAIEEMADIADGRIFSGSQAKNLGLVDELGTLQDAIDAAASLGKIRGKPKVIYPEKRRKKWLEFILEDFDSEDETSSVHGLNSIGAVMGNIVLRGILRLGGLGLSEFESPAITGVVSAAQDLPSGIYWLWGGR